MRTRPRRLIQSCAAIVLCLATIGAAPIAAAASDASEPPADDQGWRYEVIPYLWLSEIHGDITVRDRTASATVGFGELFDLLFDGDLIAGMGHFEAHHGKLSLFGDLVGSLVRTDEHGQLARRDVKVELESDAVIFEFGAAYQLLDVADHRFRLDALAGGRYNHFFSEIKVEGETVDRSKDAQADFVDPFFGTRFAVGLVDALSFNVRADVGGFGAGSDLAWSVLGAFRYDTPWRLGRADVAVLAGYKVYDIDYGDGAGGRVHDINLQMRGPVFGVGFAF